MHTQSTQPHSTRNVATMNQTNGTHSTQNTSLTEMHVDNLIPKMTVRHALHSIYSLHTKSHIQSTEMATNTYFQRSHFAHKHDLPKTLTQSKTEDHNVPDDHEVSYTCTNYVRRICYFTKCICIRDTVHRTKRMGLDCLLKWELNAYLPREYGWAFSISNGPTLVPAPAADSLKS